MNAIQHLRRLAGFVAGLAAALLAAALTGPAALAAPAARAMRVAPGGSGGSAPVVVQTRTIVQGGMPGWQIALIAVGAALLAAVLAVLLDRVRQARLGRRESPAQPAAMAGRL